MNPLPETERSNDRTAGLDVLDDERLIELLVDEQREAVRAVHDATPALAAALREIVPRLQRGGRLHYVGAGTSGRLGTLDASEMPPTFGTPPDLVCPHIAGGDAALRRAIEGAEDDREAGANEMRAHVKPRDVVVGISASGGAPYVLGALAEARAAGAWTIAVANVSRAAAFEVADAAIPIVTGPEPLTGSTRLKAGTAQKILLNALSTATMVRLGKVYDNLMVDVVATNEKLRRRAQRLVMQLTAADENEARALLADACGSVKTAVVMRRLDVSHDAARRLLEQHSGSLRAVLER